MRKINVTPEAQRNLNQIADYILKRWSLKAALDFSTALEEAFEDISKTPEAFEYIPKFDCRKKLVNQRTLLFYQFDTDSVDVLKAFDARVNYENEEKWK